MGSKLQRPISDRPAMPKKVWYTSAMSSGRSEIPPPCSSCRPTYSKVMLWSLWAQAPCLHMALHSNARTYRYILLFSFSSHRTLTFTN